MDFVSLLKHITDNPEPSTLIGGLLGYLFWRNHILSNRVTSLKGADLEKIVNERIAISLKSTSEDIEKLKKENEELAISKNKETAIMSDEIHALQAKVRSVEILNQMLLTKESFFLKDLAAFAFNLSDMKAIWFSHEYQRFMPEKMTIAEYISRNNSFVHRKEIAEIYDKNNKIAEKYGFWMGYEPIEIRGEDKTKDYFVVKWVTKDASGNPFILVGFAKEIDSPTDKLIKSFVKDYCEYNSLEVIAA